MTTWPTVELGRVLKHRKEFIEIDDLTTYARPRVRLHAQGIVQRDRVLGAEIKTKKQQVCRPGEFLVAEIDAKVGGFGVVPDELDGSLVSSHYFLFQIDASMLDRRFLDFYSRTRGFREQVEAQGSTNYAAIRPADVLAYQVPLPPLPEQRRIVSRIEAIAGKVEEARRLRREAEEAVGGLLASRINEIFGRLARDCPPQPLSRFDPHVTSGPRNWAKHYEVTGHRFYRAQDIGPSGAVLNDSRVYVTPPPGGQGRSATLVAGDLMIVITGATVGRVALFANGMEPGFVSQHVAICRLPRNQVNSEFVLWGLRGPDGQSQLLGQRYGQGKPGLNLENVGALSLPFPPIEEQQRVVQYLRAYGRVVEELAVEQESSAASMHGMLPSLLDKAFRGEM